MCEFRDNEGSRAEQVSLPAILTPPSLLLSLSSPEGLGLVSGVVYIFAGIGVLTWLHVKHGVSGKRGSAFRGARRRDLCTC
jgi:hypothetical protein